MSTKAHMRAAARCDLVPAICSCSFWKRRLRSPIDSSTPRSGADKEQCRIFRVHRNKTCWRWHGEFRWHSWMASHLAGREKSTCHANDFFSYPAAALGQFRSRFLQSDILAHPFAQEVPALIFRSNPRQRHLIEPHSTRRGNWINWQTQPTRFESG